MTITDKTRKLLWGRSGNRCAMCKCELVMPSTELDENVIIGDECHIAARNPGGPRWDSNLSEKDLDSFHNLILLCKVHHKVIDDQPNSYPIGGLKKLKAKHELWVSTKLTKDRQAMKYKIAKRVLYGKDLIAIVAGAHLYDFDYDEPKNDKELDHISNFLQNAQDIGDFGDEMEMGNRVKIGLEITELIEELEKYNYWVFGTREQRKYKVNDNISLWDVAVLRVLKKSNPLIKLREFNNA